MERIQEGPPVKRRTFLFAIKRLLSYIWPITPERCVEDRDIKLELEQGNLVVNKGAANYSYGQLQDAFAQFFMRAEINWTEIKEVLILGYGTGSVADLIDAKSASANITGVELKPCLLSWEKDYVKDHSRNVICDDAAKFVTRYTRQYDMIIIDIFDELDVPEPFRGIEFLQRCRDLLSPGGTLIYNFVIDREEHRIEYSDLQVTLSDLFRMVSSSEHYHVNRIILAK